MGNPENGYTVVKDYNSGHLIDPLPSHDGHAVVDMLPGSVPIWFDKTFFFDPLDINNGETLILNISINTLNVIPNVPYPVRQIATAEVAPIPGSLLLLGSGFLGLLGWRLRKN